MQDLVESTWRWRDAGIPMRRRKRIVSTEIMEFLTFSPVSPWPRKTLKGVALRRHPRPALIPDPVDRDPPLHDGGVCEACPRRGDQMTGPSGAGRCHVETQLFSLPLAVTAAPAVSRQPYTHSDGSTGSNRFFYRLPQVDILGVRVVWRLSFAAC
jgi:hypothetical protein